MWRKLPSVVPLLFVTGSFPYVYHQQDRVLVGGIDVDATLEIARTELEEGGFDATLTVWAIRDQIVTVDNAKTISDLYFKYIDRVASEKNETAADFGVWHFAWAISNLYRNGDDTIKAELESAYLDARRRPERLTKFKDIAFEHVNGTKVYMGDVHGAARAFARSHIVAPGNQNFLQSLDQYKMERLHPRVTEHFEVSASYSWIDDPWARGASADFLPGQLSRYRQTLRAPQGRIYFAGEYTSPWSGWMNGGLESGERAAAQIAARRQ